MDSDRKKEMQGEHVLAQHSPNPCQSFLYYYSWGFVGSGRREKYKDNMFGEAFSQPLKKFVCYFWGFVDSKRREKCRGNMFWRSLPPAPERRLCTIFGESWIQIQRKRYNKNMFWLRFLPAPGGKSLFVIFGVS